MRASAGLAAALGLALLAAAPPAAAASADAAAIHSSVQGSGNTIVFVHGWTCDETSWAGQVPAFDDQYRVVTLDLPGHGKSDAPADGQFSMARFARAIEAVRAELGADRIVLVGHSMGAAVIRQYALDYPAHVAGLVAVDGPLDVRPLANVSLGPLTREGRVALIESMFVPATSPQLRARISEMMLGTSEATAIGAQRAMFDPAIQSDATIAAPALSIFAGTSRLANDETARERLTDWSSEVFAGTGHFLMMEDPGRFNAALEAFLETRARF